MEYITQQVEETEQLAQELAKTLKPNTLLALYGDLGAGKTAFVRGLARGLGCRDRVSSPTFAIVNEYEGDMPLFHFDLYRLVGWEDLDEIGFDEYLNRGGVCAVEWSERAEEIGRQADLCVTLERLDEHRRRIIIKEAQSL